MHSTGKLQQHSLALTHLDASSLVNKNAKCITTTHSRVNHPPHRSHSTRSAQDGVHTRRTHQRITTKTIVGVSTNFYEHKTSDSDIPSQVTQTPACAPPTHVQVANPHPLIARTPPNPQRSRWCVNKEPAYPLRPALHTARARAQCIHIARVVLGGSMASAPPTVSARPVSLTMRALQTHRACCSTSCDPPLMYTQRMRGLLAPLLVSVAPASSRITCLTVRGDRFEDGTANEANPD